MDRRYWRHASHVVIGLCICLLGSHINSPAKAAAPYKSRERLALSTVEPPVKHADAPDHLLPTPTPTEPAVSATTQQAEPAVSVHPDPVVGGVDGVICAAAARYGVSCATLLRVASCESGLNLYAHNPSGATGLFQFIPSTFSANGGRDIYSAYDQADVAARMFSQGQAYQWTCR